MGVSRPEELGALRVVLSAISIGRGARRAAWRGMRPDSRSGLSTLELQDDPLRRPRFTAGPTRKMQRVQLWSSSSLHRPRSERCRKNT